MAKKKKPEDKHLFLGTLYSGQEIKAVREILRREQARCDNRHCRGEIRSGDVIINVYEATTGICVGSFHGTNPRCVASTVASHVALEGGEVEPVGFNDWHKINWCRLHKALTAKV